eukprot:GILJ01006813.1.p1 GENE.GILJ01006813.1~~GILJ01006813.1.p1  ORF type:complete len:663 (+),score=77.45 GILJ01006813.1:163-2151(+)
MVVTRKRLKSNSCEAALHCTLDSLDSQDTRDPTMRQNKKQRMVQHTQLEQVKREACSRFCEFPSELLLLSLSFLDPVQDLLACSGVNVQFRDAAFHGTLWQGHVYFPYLVMSSPKLESRLMVLLEKLPLLQHVDTSEVGFAEASLLKLANKGAKIRTLRLRCRKRLCSGFNAVLRNCSRLEHLHVEFSCASSKVAMPRVPSDLHFPRLSRLCIKDSCNYLNDEDTINILRSAPNLVKVSFSGSTHLGVASAGCLRALSGCPKVSKLVLQGEGYEAMLTFSAPQLEHLFFSLRQLTILKLRHVSFPPSALPLFSSFAPNLQHLFLRCCSVLDTDDQPLQPLVVRPFPSLTLLSLYDNELHDNVWRALVAAASQVTRFEWVDHYMVPSEDAFYEIRKLQQLDHLTLSVIPPDSSLRLSQCLGEMPRLTAVDFGMDVFDWSDECADPLPRCPFFNNEIFSQISVCAQLKRISMCRAAVTGELFRLLSVSCPQLVSIVLNQCTDLNRIPKLDRPLVHLSTLVLTNCGMLKTADVRRICHNTPNLVTLRINYDMYRCQDPDQLPAQAKELSELVYCFPLILCDRLEVLSIDTWDVHCAESLSFKMQTFCRGNLADLRTILKQYLSSYDLSSNHLSAQPISSRTRHKSKQEHPALTSTKSNILRLFDV